MFNINLLETKRIVLIIFLVSLIVNMFFNIAIIGITNIPKGDSFYITWAKNINHYINEVQDSRYPVWPIFLSFLISIFGFNLFWIKLILSILGAINCVLIFLIAKQFVKKNIAILAGIIACFYPNLIMWTSYLLTETLCNTLFLSGLYLLLNIDKNPKWRLIIVGLLLGFSALTRTGTIVFFPFIFIWIILKYYPSITTIIYKSFYIFLPIVLMLLIWSYRNYRVSDSFTLQTNSGGFYGVWNEWALERDPLLDKGAWRDDYYEKIPELKNMEYKERQRFLHKRLKGYIIKTIKEKPFDLVKITYWNIKRGMFGRLWNRDSIVKYLFYIYYDVISLLSLIGIVITWGKRKSYLFLYMGLFVYILTIIIIGGDVRFRVPFEFSFIILTSIVIYHIFNKQNDIYI